MVNHYPHFCYDDDQVQILDQTKLPFAEVLLSITSSGQAADAIRSMQVRGAPLIGAMAGFGVAWAMREACHDEALDQAVGLLSATRPTAVNLHWALARMEKVLRPLVPAQRAERAWQEAQAIARDDALANAAIGRAGLGLLQQQAHALGAGTDARPLQLMTHCNAGWLATVAHGTALAPIYAAVAAGLAVHVWVSETRPRNQGLLTAWELQRSGVACTIVADNAAGWLLAQGKVDAVIVGADRIAANGDTANKVGTYLKALAAQAHQVPFYVAAPRSTIDFGCPTGEAIPIEQREGNELRYLVGLDANAEPGQLLQIPEQLAVLNPAFDVTPARWITQIVTEQGAVIPQQLNTLQERQ